MYDFFFYLYVYIIREEKDNSKSKVLFALSSYNSDVELSRPLSQRPILQLLPINPCKPFLESLTISHVASVPAIAIFITIFL